MIYTIQGYKILFLLNTEVLLVQLMFLIITTFEYNSIGYDAVEVQVFNQVCKKEKVLM